MLGLRFCARAFTSCGEWGPLFIVARGLFIVVTSLVAEHRLQTRRLSSCGSQAYLLRGMWDLPRPGLKPVSPALAGRFSTTAPPGKPNQNTSNSPFVAISALSSMHLKTLPAPLFTQFHSNFHIFRYLLQQHPVINTNVCLSLLRLL